MEAKTFLIRGPLKERVNKYEGKRTQLFLLWCNWVYTIYFALKNLLFALN